MNVIEGLQKEINRRREILPAYEEIPEGAFGAAMLRADIERAKKVIASGDTVKMVRLYAEMKDEDIE